AGTSRSRARLAYLPCVLGFAHGAVILVRQDHDHYRGIRRQELTSQREQFLIDAVDDHLWAVRTVPLFDRERRFWIHEKAVHRLQRGFETASRIAHFSQLGLIGIWGDERPEIPIG